MTVSQLIQPFRKGETVEERRAKIMRVNDLTESAAQAILRGDVILAGALHADLEKAGIIVNPDSPTLWQAEEQP